MKIRPVRSELFHADRRMDMTKVTVAFCNFKKPPKKMGIIVINPLAPELFFFNLTHSVYKM